MNRVGKLLVVAALVLVAAEARATSKNIWLSAAEIAALDTTGAAWANVAYAARWQTSPAPANIPWGTPNLSDQVAATKHAVFVIAGALVGARTADSPMKVRVRDGIMAAKRTLDHLNEYPATTTLELGRQLGAYVIAADIIDLQSLANDSDLIFRPWVDSMRTRVFLDSNEHWQTIKLTHEKTANNWGAFAGASRIAASLYLGDAADVARADSVYRAQMGERSYYPLPVAGSSNGYFMNNIVGDWDSTWYCAPPGQYISASWVGVNPPGCFRTVTSGIGLGQVVNLDGALMPDITRDTHTLHFPPEYACCAGWTYPWEALQGLFVQAEMLYRAGYLKTYERSSQALRRAMDFQVRCGWTSPTSLYNPGSTSEYVVWIANKRYGTTYPTAATFPSGSPGRIMSWTNWTHAPAAPCPPSTAPPAPLEASSEASEEPVDP
jgi:hypothetical protein